MPIVVAHAGGSAHAPANTRGAYRRAHAAYEDVWMEFDTQFSADGEFMAVHDDTLDRTTDWSGPVADKTAEELQSCDAAAHFDGWGFEPVMRVRDILTEGRDEGWRLIAEIKNIPGQISFDESGQRYADALLSLIDETSFPLDRLVAICFWAPTLDAIRAQRADIALGYLSTPRAGVTAAQNLELCVERGYDVCSPNHLDPDLTSDLVADAHQRGVQVHAWTMNTPEHIARAVDIGLDGITSDHPELVYEALRTR